MQPIFLIGTFEKQQKQEWCYFNPKRPLSLKKLWKVSKLTIQRVIEKLKLVGKNSYYGEILSKKLIRKLVKSKVVEKTCRKTCHKTCQTKTLLKKNSWKTCQKTLIQTECIKFFKKSNQIFNWKSFLSFWIEVTFESGFTVFSYDFSLLYIFPTRSEWNDVSIHHEKKQRGITGCSK